MSSFIGKKLLVVQSSGRVWGSVSRELVDVLTKKLAPSSTVVRETASTPFVDQKWISSCFNPAATEEDKNSHSFTTSNALAKELIDAEVIVIGVSLYNFNIPASLKAWIDMVVLQGKTFKYGPTGPVPLLAGMNKKAYVIISSGGAPIGSPVDFASPYIKHIFKFIGIDDVTIIAATAGKKDDALKQIEAVV